MSIFKEITAMRNKAKAAKMELKDFIKREVTPGTINNLSFRISEDSSNIIIENPPDNYPGYGTRLIRHVSMNEEEGRVLFEWLKNIYERGKNDN